MQAELTTPVGKNKQGSGEGLSDLYPQERPEISQRVKCYHVHPYCRLRESIRLDKQRQPMGYHVEIWNTQIYDDFQCFVVENNKILAPFI